MIDRALDYVYTLSDAAKICFSCTAKKCGGTCDRYRKEISKLKKRNRKSKKKSNVGA